MISTNVLRTFSIIAIASSLSAGISLGVLVSCVAGCVSLSDGQKETIGGLIGSVPTQTPAPEPTATPEPTPTAAPAGFVEVDHSGFVVTGDEVADFAAWYGADTKYVDGVTAIVIENLAPSRQKYLHDKWCQEKHKDMPTYNGGLVAAWGCE